MMNDDLSPQLAESLADFTHTLIDQQAARIIVSPHHGGSGFWFGGGNLIEDSQGRLLLVGRYRNHGDSRAGVQLGDRGLELAIFRSEDRGQSFDKILSWSKQDLRVGESEVLSIEGSALRWTTNGVELLLSSEKTNLAYPVGLEAYQKPGTGVWTIDLLQAEHLEGLQDAKIRTVLRGTDPQFTHVKDPHLYEDPQRTLVLFCTHPFNWTSSNTAWAVKGNDQDDYTNVNFDFFPRGFTWDVAITRGTCLIDVPRIGAFANRTLSLMFYDGGESLRNLEPHIASPARPRGYSCEELGGVAYVLNREWQTIKRLSHTLPWFVSPYGTGSSRYVDVHRSTDGYFVTWQQSQPDQSQPLVMNFVPHDRVREILA